MAVTHFEAAHVNPVEAAQAASSPGPATAFGIIAGGVFGMIGGLAQYNAVYTSAPKFVLPTVFVFVGGIVGTAVLGLAGWTADKLIARIKRG